MEEVHEFWQTDSTVIRHIESRFDAAYKALYEVWEILERAVENQIYANPQRRDSLGRRPSQLPPPEWLNCVNEWLRAAGLTTTLSADIQLLLQELNARARARRETW